MLFLYRPRQTWMPYRLPRERTEQDAYNAHLQEAYAATRQVAPSPPADALPAAPSDPIARLRELGHLRESGVLTEAEFDSLKAKVLGEGEHAGMISNAARAETLRRALRASLEGDRSTLRQLYTDDVKAWTPAMSASSAAELVAQLERRDEAFSDIQLEVAPLDVGGDYACAEWSVTMTHSGPLEVADGATLEPTGTRVMVNGATVAEFRGDQICSFRQYWDELAVFEQLGLTTGADA